MCLGVGENSGAVLDPARIGIECAKIDAGNACGGDGGGAHGAGLQRGPEVTALKPLLAQYFGGCADHEYLRMGCGVGPGAGLVACRREHRTVGTDQHSTHGYLAPSRSGLGLFERTRHVGGKGHAITCLADASKTSLDVIARAQHQARMTKPSSPAGERIAKVLARAGVASRREAERMIETGRVAVNGAKIGSPALNVTSTDWITVDGQPVGPADRPRLWRYNKPNGLVTTERDEKGRKTVFDALPPELPRVLSIGRLDLTSEGLLLLTNDGALKRKLELPETGYVRKYRVRAKGRVTEAALESLRRGVVVEGERFQPMKVSLDKEQGANAWFTVGLREGKNREVRRAFATIDLEVNRLIRTSYGPFQLGTLARGEVDEVKAKVLRDQLGLKIEADESAPLRPARPNPPRPADPSASLRKRPQRR